MEKELNSGDDFRKEIERYKKFAALFMRFNTENKILLTQNDSSLFSIDLIIYKIEIVS